MLSEPPADLDQGEQYDKLAALVRTHMDMGLVYREAGIMG